MQPTQNQLDAARELVLSRRPLFSTKGGWKIQVPSRSYEGKRYDVDLQAGTCGCKWKEVHAPATCTHQLAAELYLSAERKARAA